MYENSFNMVGRPKSPAKADERFYDTEEDNLSREERQQAMALLAEQKAAEGSIFILYPNEKKFDELCADRLSSARERGEAVANLLNAHKVAIDTVVIPGCGSSPLGTAAFGKSVAKITGKPVAAIVAGQGSFDMWMEAASGGTLMAPMANTLNAFDKALELIVQVNPMAKAWAQMYVRDLVNTMHEAATLYALLKTRLVDEKFVLRDPPARGLDMIVSHSKGNWNVLVALLNFEFELAEKIAENNRGVKVEKRIDVVTFGNPVDLPNLHDMMKMLFHYHQFAGTNDPLMALNSSKTLISQIWMAGKVTDKSFDPKEDPDMWLFRGRSHNLIKNREDHMPIEDILPAIRPAA
jgi:hypothetical protein